MWWRHGEAALPVVHVAVGHVHDKPHALLAEEVACVRGARGYTLIRHMACDVRRYNC
jgi:hypothetical protein